MHIAFLLFTALHNGGSYTFFRHISAICNRNCTCRHSVDYMISIHTIYMNSICLLFKTQRIESTPNRRLSVGLHLYICISIVVSHIGLPSLLVDHEIISSGTTGKSWNHFIRNQESERDLNHVSHIWILGSGHRTQNLSILHPARVCVCVCGCCGPQDETQVQ